MIVFVRYNLGPGVAVELQEEASVAELKEVVGSQQGVEPEQLRVLFAGRELRSTATLQGCDLPEQSTVHVVPLLSGSASSSSRLLPLANGDEEHGSLTRLDLSSSRLPSTSSGLEVIREGSDRRPEEAREEAREETREEAREETREETSEEPREETREETREEASEETREETREEPREETREETREEASEETREETSEEVQAAGLKGLRTCNTFFVYCKSCKSVQPGKLRVRCRSCRQTTLTLSRGPSCWDDVLLRGRIHGTCQSNGCHGEEAEFFMKCGSHPTADDDLSVALDLILNNRRNVPCIACTEIIDVVLVFQCADRHVICLDCFRRYGQTRLNERQFVYHHVIGYSLPCAAGCADSLVTELHHFRILGDDQYGRYLQYGAEECLLMSGGLMCPSPGCGAGLVPPEGSRRVECDRQLGCGFIFCKDCREGYHEGACHAEPAPPTGEASQGFVVDEEASLRGRWDRASLLLVEESTKRCPQCSVPVERNGGCMHMQCPLCRAEWCWLCGVRWNRECMGDHWFG